MKRLLPILLAVALSALSLAQDFRYAVLWGAGGGATPIVGTRVGFIENVLGTKNNLEGWAFAGVNLQDKVPTAGAAVVAPFRFARNLTGYLGAGSFLENGSPVRFGVILGFEVQFGAPAPAPTASTLVRLFEN